MLNNKRNHEAILPLEPASKGGLSMAKFALFTLNNCQLLCIGSVALVYSNFRFGLERLNSSSLSLSIVQLVYTLMPNYEHLEESLLLLPCHYLTISITGNIVQVNPCKAKLLLA